MPIIPLDDDELLRRVQVLKECGGSIKKAAETLGIARSSMQSTLRRASERGLYNYQPVMPGFRVAKVTNTPRGDIIQQVPDRGEEFAPLNTLAVKGRTSWVDVLPDGSRIATREVIMERADAERSTAAFEAAIAAIKEDIPRLVPTAFTGSCNEHLLNQYTVTDLHFGMLAWAEETGDDYDLKIAEDLLIKWFAAAIRQAPDAQVGLLAQLGDMLHYDGMVGVTPESKHVLDVDSRFQKVIRVVIRVLRKVVLMMLDKHEQVHLIMAQGNHDPASSAWLREVFAVMYEDEKRISVETSPHPYYAYEWGKTALFYHHGHKRGLNDIEAAFVGMFRELYGRTKYAYAHIGHLHSDAFKPKGLIKVERHETIAGKDAFNAAGGWLADRSAKRITYSSLYGEVSRNIIRPEELM